MIHYMSHDERKVLVLSYRDNTRCKFTEKIVWASVYNDDVSIQKYEDEKKKQKDSIKLKQRKRNVVPMKTTEQVIKSLYEQTTSNPYDTLKDRCGKLNDQFDDDLTPETVMSVMETYDRRLKVKPSNISFTRIIDEHELEMKIQANKAANLIQHSVAEPKGDQEISKFKKIHFKLCDDIGVLEDKVCDILIKHNYKEYKRMIDKDGILNSLPLIISKLCEITDAILPIEEVD